MQIEWLFFWNRLWAQDTRFLIKFIYFFYLFSFYFDAMSLLRNLNPIELEISVIWHLIFPSIEKFYIFFTKVDAEIRTFFFVAIKMKVNSNRIAFSIFCRENRASTLRFACVHFVCDDAIINFADFSMASFRLSDATFSSIRNLAWNSWDLKLERRKIKRLRRDENILFLRNGWRYFY